MFFSSVLVPSVAVPAGRIDTFASIRSEPSSMFTSETPMRRSVAWSSRPNSAACAAEVRSGSVTISTSGVPPRLKSTTLGLGAVDAPRRAGVDQLRGVLLQVHAVDAHVAEPARPAERDVVLADLVALRQVRIEVVLAVEDRARRDLALERHRDHQPVVDRLGVGHRQRAGVAEADRADERVRLLAERERAAAEHLRPRAQLHVDLDADDGLVVHPHRHPSNAIDFSSACAASRMRASLNAGPAIWKPTGSPSERPHGIEMAGMPASGIGTV